MIQIEEKEIVFSPEAGFFDKKHPVVRRRLEFGYSCPVCKYPVLAAYEEPTDHTIHPNTYIAQSVTQYLYEIKNFELVNGKRGQFLMETKHFTNLYSNNDHWSGCKLNIGVFNLKPGKQYAAMRLFNTLQRLYYSANYHEKVKELLLKYEKGPESFLEAIQNTLTEIPDVCGSLPNLFLLNRNSWNYSTLMFAYNKMKTAQASDSQLNSQPETGEEDYVDEDDDFDDEELEEFDDEDDDDYDDEEE